VKVDGWYSREEALQIIEESHERWRKRRDGGG
jgi:inorganic pyrophosphatase